ncbi:MAG: hypothetical protein ACLR4X_03470 [Clostridia bacterium]
MEDEEYRMQIACKQVYTILNLYNRELLCLILPEEVLRKLKENSAKDYEYNINPNTFSPDDITEEASAILLIIFDKYFANQTQKDKINRFLNTQDNENFDYNLLFKNKKENNNNSSNCSDLVVYEKTNIIKKLIRKTRSIFQKRKKL